MSEILWKPTQSIIDSSSVTKLQNQIGVNDFESLHAWSIANLGEFWSEAWQATKIIGTKGEVSYISDKEFFKARFFPDAKLNVAQNLIENDLTTEIAITAIDENGNKTEISWINLRRQVNQAANAMLNIGIKPGDRVVAWTPNKSETIIFAIAALKIGAIVSTASTDFAPLAVLDRFEQIKPKFLLGCTEYQYNGKVFNCADSLAQIAAGLPTLNKVIVINQNDSKFESWDHWISSHDAGTTEFEKFEFDHPGFILFSSGTTGKPKCIVHKAAGVLLKLKAEQLFNFDLTSKDKVFFYTTTGWMMWNWLLYVLASATSIVIYDGNPTHLKVDKLLDIAATLKVSHLGLSAKYIDLLSKSKITGEKYDLTNLKTIISTGSVLSAEAYKFVYEKIKKNIQLASISGGTDICGCFVSAVPTKSIIAGEIQGACLGMAVDVFDDDGKSLAAGEKGELVCTKPFPSMPLKFWNDDEDVNYKKSYFSKFPEVWTHGDFASKTENTGFVIHGRSDATLNSKGVRIGTAEIYRVVEQLDEVVEALAVAKEIDNDSKVVLFIVTTSGIKMNQELELKIKDSLRKLASPRHVPDLIIQAPELPKTKSNKLVELAVSDLINGRKVRNKDGLVNPNSLDWFASLQINF